MPSLTFPITPVLAPVPGGGFTEPTPQPDPVGTGPASDENAMAQWAVVRGQTHDGSFVLAAYGTHVNDLDRIEMCVDNGAWYDVGAPARIAAVAPASDVAAAITAANAVAGTGGADPLGKPLYGATLDASWFSDGQHTARFRAYPVAGVPRVSPDLVFYTNAGHSLDGNTLYVHPTGGNDVNPGTSGSPMQHIDAAFAAVGDGGTVVLQAAGTYAVALLWGPTHTRYVTIRPAEGIARADVVIVGTTDTGSGIVLRQHAMRVRWVGVTFDDYNWTYEVASAHTGGNELTWFDRCRWHSTGTPDALGKIPGGNVKGNVLAISYTDCVKTRGFNGFRDVGLVVNCEVTGIQEDAFTNSRLVVNSVAHDIVVPPIADPLEAVHSDIWQGFGGHENTIVYGVTAYNVRDSQGLLPAGEYVALDQWAYLDCAFVDIKLHMTSGTVSAGYTVLSQFSQRHRNVLVRNVDWFGQGVIARTGDPEWLAVNLVFRNCTMPGWSILRHLDPDLTVNPNLPDGVTWDNVTAND